MRRARERAEHADGEQNDAGLNAVLFGQRDIARQHGLLHQEQYGGRDGDGLVVAEHAQQNQQYQKQRDNIQMQLYIPEKRPL